MERTLHRWALPVTLTAYAVLLFLLWRMEGPHTDKEALKYLGCADQVLHGDLHDLLGSYRHYGMYVIFLLPFVALGMPLLAIPAQIGLSIIAGLALGRLVSRLGGNVTAGRMATALFLLTIPVQVWVLALYTESFFASAVVLLMEQVLGRERPGRWALPLAIVVLFGRPVGPLFVGPLFICWFGRKWPSKLRWSGYAAVLAVAMVLPGVPRPQLEITVNSEVLCGCCTDGSAAQGFTGRSLLDTQIHLAQLHGLGEQVISSVKRMLSLYTFNRPFYSSAHNLLLLPYYLLYPLAALGLWTLRKERHAELLLAVLMIYTLLVGLTCNEWSGRFLVPILPLLMIPACLFLLRRFQAQRP